MVQKYTLIIHSMIKVADQSGTNSKTSYGEGKRLYFFSKDIINKYVNQESIKNSKRLNDERVIDRNSFSR